MCDTTIICTGHHDSGNAGTDVIGAGLVGSGKFIYWCAERGAEALIWAGRWFSGKPMVRPETWAWPYRFTRPVRAVARTLLTGIGLAGWLHPIITGITLAIVGGMVTWLVLRRRGGAVPVAAVPGVPRRPAIESAPERPSLAAGQVVDARILDAEVVTEARPAITMGVAARRIGSLLGGRR